jgi:hypothetical protein
MCWVSNHEILLNCGENVAIEQFKECQKEKQSYNGHKFIRIRLEKITKILEIKQI